MILDYCRDLFDILENLEVLLKSSEKLREDYRQKITDQIARQASILDILVSIGMIVYLMPDKTVFFSNLVPGTGPNVIKLRKTEKQEGSNHLLFYFILSKKNTLLIQLFYQ